MRLTTNGDGQYEVGAVHDTGHVNAAGAAIVERCDDYPQCDAAIHFWSVYEHQQQGGVECIADCPTEAYALGIANALEAK